MASFVNVELPKCSICQDGFDREDAPVAHRGGEQHPFHRNCLQELINSGNQSDPIYGIRPIKCPVCIIELPKGLPDDPIRNPSPSVHAASNQLSRSAPASSPTVSSSAPERDASELDEMQPERSQYPEHLFDRLSLDEQIRQVNETFNKGLISEDICAGYIEALQALRR
jgi:hypothetical protein